MNRPEGFCWRRIGVYGGDHSCPRLQQEIHCRNCDVFRHAARALLDRAMEPLPLSIPAAVDQDGGAVRRMLCVRLGQHWLALDGTSVVEVAEATHLRRIAHRCKGQLEGLMAVRGELHLCVSLIELLQLGTRQELAGERSRLVLVASADHAPIGFRASEVIGLRPVQQASIEEVPPTLPAALTQCLNGIVPFEHGRMALLETKALAQVLAGALYS